MTIIIFQFFFFIVSLLSQSKQLINQRFGLINFLVYAVYVALTSARWETGTDWNSYLDFFNSFENNSQREYLLSFEPGYAFINYTIYVVGGDFTLLLLVQSLMIAYFLYKSARLANVSPVWFLTILLLIQSQFYYPVRQQLALSAALYFTLQHVKLKTSESIFKFALKIGIAASIHLSALLLLLATTVRKRVIHPFKASLILVFIGSTLYFYRDFMESRVINYLIINDYEFESSRNFLRLTERVLSTLLLILIINLSEKFINKDEVMNAYIKMVVIGLFCSVIALMYFPYLARVVVYFNAFEAIVLCQIIEKFRSISVISKILVIFLVALYVLKFSASLMPYWDLINPYIFFFESTSRSLH